MQHELGMNWLHQKLAASKVTDESSILPFVKAKNGATNIAIRTNLKMRLRLYRCYKVACEWCFKPFLNLRDARRSVASELCKPVAPSSMLFANECLAKKQEDNSKSTEDTKAQSALNK